MTLCHTKSNRCWMRLDGFTSFAADNIVLHDKKRELWCYKRICSFHILEFHKWGLDSCICLFFLPWVVRLLAECVVVYVHTDIPVVSQECIVYCFGWLLDQIHSLCVCRINCSSFDVKLLSGGAGWLDCWLDKSGELSANLNIDLPFRLYHPQLLRCS